MFAILCLHESSNQLHLQCRPAGVRYEYTLELRSNRAIITLFLTSSSSVCTFVHFTCPTLSHYAVINGRVTNHENGHVKVHLTHGFAFHCLLAQSISCSDETVQGAPLKDKPSKLRRTRPHLPLSRETSSTARLQECGGTSYIIAYFVPSTAAGRIPFRS